MERGHCEHEERKVKWHKKDERIKNELAGFSKACRCDEFGKKVVESVAAPLPPSRADMEHLEGDNVREKFLSFLMAETDDD